MESKQFYAIIAALKRCFSRSAIKKEVLASAKCPRKKGPRGGARYRCVKCKKDFGVTGVQVDHIEPVIPVDRPAKEMSWDEIISRLFCDPENLQVLCKACHKRKSSRENKDRKAYRKGE
jgi:5-methylcytosine-specific restriction endonuclease McrA